MTVDIGTSAGEVLAAVKSGQVSVTEVVSERLAALHAVHERTRAIAAFGDDRALADAQRLDEAFAAGGVTGPLHGIPVTVKDWIDVEGFPCAGDTGQVDRWPHQDATVVARLRRAGAVVLAKTHAWGPSGAEQRVGHPVDPRRTPGGSSTGEAVVVAAGASVLGLGSDSGGSIRLPAAWCGVLGLKPTAGRVPGTGHFPRIGALNDGRTQIGPLARHVSDLERVLAVTAGPDLRDAGVPPVTLQRSDAAALDGATFAVLAGEEPWWPDADQAAALDRAAASLSAAGMIRNDWQLPWLNEALDITRRYWARTSLSGEEADRQLWDWDRFRRRYLRGAETIDFVLTPACLEPAPEHREIHGKDFIFTLPASLTGSPAIAIPAGVDARGLPLAVQLIGRPWEDHRVLAAASLLAP
ncbi:MAG: amidase [Streptosporangiaceae bacterium]